MGSGSTADETRAAEVGRWLAAEGVHLLTGGGAGAMAAVSRAFAESEDRPGLVIGILPARSPDDPEPPPGYPNPWVELPVRTHLHLSGTEGTTQASRNHINVLTADVVIALSGSWGTQSEVELAVQYGKPVVAYLQERTAIPDLPETVLVTHDLPALQSFVRHALGRAP